MISLFGNIKLHGNILTDCNFQRKSPQSSLTKVLSFNALERSNFKLYLTRRNIGKFQLKARIIFDASQISLNIFNETVSQILQFAEAIVIATVKNVQRFRGRIRK